jgi:hypothetical protein
MSFILTWLYPKTLPLIADQIALHRNQIIDHLFADLLPFSLDLHTIILRYLFEEKCNEYLGSTKFRLYLGPCLIHQKLAYGIFYYTNSDRILVASVSLAEEKVALDVYHDYCFITVLNEPKINTNYFVSQFLFQTTSKHRYVFCSEDNTTYWVRIIDVRKNVIFEIWSLAGWRALIKDIPKCVALDNFEILCREVSFKGQDARIDKRIYCGKCTSGEHCPAPTEFVDMFPFWETEKIEKQSA